LNVGSNQEGVVGILRTEFGAVQRSLQHATVNTNADAKGAKRNAKGIIQPDVGGFVEILIAAGAFKVGLI
jgi:hypothetical protein